MPPRLDLRVTGTGSAAYHARRVYRPLRRGPRLVHDAVSYAVAAGFGRSASAPLPDVAALVRDLGYAPHAIAARRSWADGRWLLAFGDRRGVVAVAKVGRGDDARLRNEAAMLQELSGRDVGVGYPVPLAATEWRGRFVLVMRALSPQSRRVFDPQAADALARRLTRPDDGRGPLVHGDLTPWNVWREGSRLVVMDWELAERRSAPLWDLAKFVVWTGALAGAWSPAMAVSLLTGDDGIGVQHVLSLGLGAESATVYLAAFLEAGHDATSSPALVDYLAEMHSLLGRGGAGAA